MPTPLAQNPQGSFETYRGEGGDLLIAFNRDGTIGSQGISFPDGTSFNTASQPQPLSVMQTTDDRTSATFSTILDSTIDKSAVVLVAPASFLFLFTNGDTDDNGGWNTGDYFFLWNKGAGSVTVSSANAGDTWNGTSLYIMQGGQVLLFVTDGNGHWTVVPINPVSGSNKELQFNDNAVLAGATGLLWDKTSSQFTVTSSINTGVAPGLSGMSGSTTLLNTNSTINPTVTGLFWSTSYAGTGTPLANAVVSNAIAAFVGDVNTDKISSVTGLVLSAIGGHATAVYGSIIGLQCLAASSTTGTCNSIEAIQTYWRGENHSSVITTAYGLHIKSPQNAGSLTVGNNVALQIDDPTIAGATTSWAIFSAGASHFLKGNIITNGLIGLGTTTTPDTSISRTAAGNVAIGTGAQGSTAGTLNCATVEFSTALVALGGGSAATLGTVGGSGPVTAAQNTWLLLKDSTGANFWVPAWK